MLGPSSSLICGRQWGQEKGRRYSVAVLALRVLNGCCGACYTAWVERAARRLCMVIATGLCVAHTTYCPLLGCIETNMWSGLTLNSVLSTAKEFEKRNVKCLAGVALVGTPTMTSRFAPVPFVGRR